MMPALVAPRDQLAYYDQQWIALEHRLTPLEGWNLIMANPLPGMRLAFKLRDALSAPFGVKPIHGFSGARRAAVREGERLDFFLVEKINDSQMVLTARDRHLDVMISVDAEAMTFAITASVITHNAFGRLYMVPVAPAHRWIVRAMLRRLRRSVGRAERATDRAPTTI